MREVSGKGGKTGGSGLLNCQCLYFIPHPPLPFSSAKNGGVHDQPFEGSSLEESSGWGDREGGDAAGCALWEGGQRPPAQAQEPGLS